MRIKAFREWLANEWSSWQTAWREMWAERDARARRNETVLVPIEEYSVLLDAAKREAAALELLGQAQEKIRVLTATQMRLQANLDDLATADIIHRGLAITGKVASV